jgi:hypothetical protein
LSEQAALQLPVPERSVLLTSRFVADDALLDRVRQAPARGPIVFSLDELEDLHRGLAVDANQTDDSKRRKAIHKILTKIEEWLGDELDEFDEDDEDDEERAFPGFVGGDNAGSTPTSVDEVYRTIFGIGPQMTASELLSYDVTFSKSERETLLGMETIPGDIRKLVADESPEERSYQLSVRQFLVTSLSIKEALELAGDEALRQRFSAVAHRLSAGMFAALATSKAVDPSIGDRPRQVRHAATAQAFQLKITLQGSKPPIWRRVQVADCTLDELHHIIQTAMGWYGCHLHAFEWDGLVFSHPDAELDGGDYDETQVHLGQLVADGCKKLRYSYDFGDDWQHTVAVEKTYTPKPGDRLPLCVKGVGACPPEDCGGLWGYYDFLSAIRDPKHERHDEFVEWKGGNFNPEQFDLNEVNQALAR